MKKRERSEEKQVTSSIWKEARKNPKAPLSLLLSSMLIIVPFCICLVISYTFWNHTIGDGAYKYSDDVYEHIEQAIQNSVQEGIGIDHRYLQFALKHPELPLFDENGDAIQYDIADFEAKDAKANQTSPTVPKIVSTYEGNQIELVCSIQDGYFLAAVTANLTEQYKNDSGYVRNFTSLEGYMEHYRHTFGLYVLVSTLVVFFAIETVILGSVSISAAVANQLAKKKEKKEAQQEQQEELTPQELEEKPQEPQELQMSPEHLVPQD